MLLLFSKLLFAENSIDFSHADYEFIILIVGCSFICIIWLLLIIKRISSFSIIFDLLKDNPNYVRYFFKFNDFKNKSFKLEKIDVNFNYYVLIKVDADNYFCKAIKNNNDLLKIIKDYLFLSNNEIFVVKLDSIKLKENFYFYFATQFSKFNIKTISFFTIILFSMIPILISIIYLVWAGYYLKVVQLFGVLPTNTEIDMSQFLNYVFLDMSLYSIPILFIFVAMFVFPIICYVVLFYFGRFCIYIINLLFKNDLKKVFFTCFSHVYKLPIFLLVGNLFSYLIIVVITFIFLIQLIISIYKIEYPHNENISVNESVLYFADYYNFTKKFSKVRIDGEYKYSVGKDNIFLYYYNLDKDKNDFFLNEIRSVMVSNKKESLKNCKEIYMNYKIAKNEIEFSNKNKEKELNKIKFLSVLLNNKILNIDNIRKKLINNIKHFEEINSITLDDLYIDETINKCEILVTLEKEEDIDYYNFEKLNNFQLLNWIDNLKSEKKNKVKNIYYRIEDKMFKDIDDEFERL